jgi:hypothetical protein
MIEPALSRIRNINPNLPLCCWRVKLCPVCNEKIPLKSSRMGSELCPKCWKSKHDRGMGERPVPGLPLGKNGKVLAEKRVIAGIVPGLRIARNSGRYNDAVPVQVER